MRQRIKYGINKRKQEVIEGNHNIALGIGLFIFVVVLAGIVFTGVLDEETQIGCTLPPFTCNTGMVLKDTAASITCTGDTCTQQECCNSPTLGVCTGFVCPSGTNITLTPTAPCSSPECTQTECCTESGHNRPNRITGVGMSDADRAALSAADQAALAAAEAAASAEAFAAANAENDQLRQDAEEARRVADEADAAAAASREHAEFYCNDYTTSGLGQYVVGDDCITCQNIPYRREGSQVSCTDGTDSLIEDTLVGDDGRSIYCSDGYYEALAHTVGVNVSNSSKCLEQTSCTSTQYVSEAPTSRSAGTCGTKSILPNATCINPSTQVADATMCNTAHAIACRDGLCRSTDGHSCSSDGDCVSGYCETHTTYADTCQAASCEAQWSDCG